MHSENADPVSIKVKVTYGDTYDSLEAEVIENEPKVL